MSELAIEIKNLEKSYNNIEAVKNINFKIYKIKKTYNINKLLLKR